MLLPNVCNVNMTGIDPMTAISDIDSGDMLLVISFPVHSENTKKMAAYARYREACVATISEGAHSETAEYADISLISEYGDYGINGTLAPLISLCGSIICLLAKNDEKAQKKLRLSEEAVGFAFPEKI